MEISLYGNSCNTIFPKMVISGYTVVPKWNFVAIIGKLHENQTLKNQKSKIKNSKSKIKNQKFKIQNSKIKNSKFKNQKSKKKICTFQPYGTPYKNAKSNP